MCKRQTAFGKKMVEQQFLVFGSIGFYRCVRFKFMHLPQFFFYKMQNRMVPKHRLHSGKKNHVLCMMQTYMRRFVSNDARVGMPLRQENVAPPASRSEAGMSKQGITRHCLFFRFADNAFKTQPFINGDC